MRYTAQLYKRHPQITMKVKKWSHVSDKNTGPYYKQQAERQILVEVKVNKGTPYMKTCMTRFSHNKVWTPMEHTCEHHLTMIYQLQRINFSTETRWSIAKNESTRKMHDKWELCWKNIYKHRLFHRTSRMQWSHTTWQVCKCTILIILKWPFNWTHYIWKKYK